MSLLQDQYGNYVMQHILKYSHPSVDQNIENVEVASSILALGFFDDFGDNIKRVAPIIHVRERVVKCPGQVSNNQLDTIK